MAIEDRDWYREERRQQRASMNQPMLFQDEAPSAVSKPRRGLPGPFNAVSLILLLLCAIAALGVAIGVSR